MPSKASSKEVTLSTLTASLDNFHQLIQVLIITELLLRPLRNLADHKPKEIQISQVNTPKSETLLRVNSMVVIPSTLTVSSDISSQLILVLTTMESLLRLKSRAEALIKKTFSQITIIDPTRM